MSLIDRLKNGDVESLGLLVKECKEICIGNLLYRTNCNREDAEDIFTEAVVNFGEKIVAGKVDDIKNIKGYMTGVCYNMWLNIYRKKEKVRTSEPDVERFFYEYLEDDPDEELPGTIKDRLFDISAKALQMLSENCKTVIKYFYLEERSMADIASLMGFANVEVARATKYKCFKKLRQEVSLLEQKTI